MDPQNYGYFTVTNKGRYSRAEAGARNGPKRQSGTHAIFKALLKHYRQESGNWSLLAFKASNYFKPEFEKHWTNQARFESRLQHQAMQATSQCLPEAPMKENVVEPLHPTNSFEHQKREAEVADLQVQLQRCQAQTNNLAETLRNTERELQESKERVQRREAVIRKNAEESTKGLKELQKKYDDLSSTNDNLSKSLAALSEENLQHKARLQIEKLRNEELVRITSQAEVIQRPTTIEVAELQKKLQLQGTELANTKQNLALEAAKNEEITRNLYLQKERNQLLQDRIQDLKQRNQGQESELASRDTWIQQTLQGCRSTSDVETQTEPDLKQQEEQELRENIETLKAKLKLTTWRVGEQRKELEFHQVALDRKNSCELKKKKRKKVTKPNPELPVPDRSTRMELREGEKSTLPPVDDIPVINLD